MSDSFADDVELVTVISPLHDGDDASGLSSQNLLPNSAVVQINHQALNEPNMNITVFDKVIEVTHEKTIHRAENDFTYVGSSNDSYNNVWMAYYDGDMRLEMTLPEKNYILEPAATNVHTQVAHYGTTG